MCCAVESSKPENPKKKSGGCKDPKGKCPCQPISGVEVVFVDFVSGHAMLKDEKTNWTDTGTLYEKPEWKKGRAEQNPVSHTMDETVTLKVMLRVTPADACTETGTLECSAPGELSFEPKSVTFKAGDNTFELTSSGKLPKEVKKIDLNLNWTATTESDTFSQSTQNELFVTIGKPIDPQIAPEDKTFEEGITYKRMEKAVEMVGGAGSTDPHRIVAHLMSKFPLYVTDPDPAVPAKYHHPDYNNGLEEDFPDVGGAWGLADYTAQHAECQAIVRFVRALIYQVGCEGDVVVMTVWTDPNIDDGKTVIEGEYGRGLEDHIQVVKGKAWSAGLTGKELVEGMEYTRQQARMNNFEACLHFTDKKISKYYPGGVSASSFNTKEEVIKLFRMLAWYSSRAEDGVEYQKIEKIVRRYK